MGRGRRIAFILAVAILALSALPAPAAQIERFTDSRGTLCITNVPKAARPAPPLATPSQEAAAPAAAPAPALPPENPAPAPAAAPAADPSPPAAGSPPAPAASSRPADLDPAALPAKPVAFLASDTLPERASPASIHPVASGAPGDPGAILSYRDARGVLHISNVRPEAADPGSMTHFPASRGDPGDGKDPVRKTVAEAPPGLRLVSFNQEERAAPRSGEGDPRSPALPGEIRTFRDRRGVLHISNIPPLPAASGGALAAREPPGVAAVEDAVSAKSRDGPENLLWRPAFWSGKSAASRAPPAAPDPPLVHSMGTIRRWRDESGVWHIMSAAPPGPEIRPSLAAGGPSSPEALAAAGAPGPPLQAPPVQPPGSLEVRRPPPASLPGSQVLAYKDRQGRLTISNLTPPGRAGGGLPLAAAPLEAVIQEAAHYYGLPVPLIQALIKVESNFVSWAVSPKGAMGLMQLMPGTALFLGVTDPFCPRQNILAGCRYLRLLLNFFNNSLPLALAAYNAGFQRVVDAGFRVPAIRETQEFVTHVMERYYTAFTAVRPTASGRGLNPGRPPST